MITKIPSAKYKVGQRVYPLFVDGTKHLFWVRPAYIIGKRVYKKELRQWLYSPDLQTYEENDARYVAYSETFLRTSFNQVIDEITSLLKDAYEMSDL